MIGNTVARNSHSPDAAPGPLDGISHLYTLGPEGTNCQRAADEWFAAQGRTGSVRLFSTLEEAVEALDGVPGAGLLGCVVYPNLHTLVFSNLHRLELVDCFVLPTHPMVLAARPGVVCLTSAATHPAPVGLVPELISERMLVNSNTQAARVCADGVTDACITTLPGARQHGLWIVQNFGPVPMGFTIHAQRHAA